MMIIFIFHSELLRAESTCKILKNFRSHVLNVNSLEEAVQQLYDSVIQKTGPELYKRIGFSGYDTENVITLIYSDSDFSYKIMCRPETLLSCVRGSKIPIKKIKTIKAKLIIIKESDWESFKILTRNGAVIEEILSTCRNNGAAYSSVIHELIQQRKLKKFR